MPLVGTGATTQALIQQALTAAGVTSIEDWVTQHPGEHLWIEIPWDGQTIPSCAACTHIRRVASAGSILRSSGIPAGDVRYGRDGSKNRPCRGIAPPVRLPRDGSG